MKKILAASVFILTTASMASATDFSLTSPQIQNGGTLQQEQLLNGFGCTGQNISPELHWQGEPAGTKSFAITVYDPDAPTGSGWWHWVVFNIPSTTHSLATGSGTQPVNNDQSDFIQSRTDFGIPGYGGACPPEGHGDHRYQFKIWALDTDHLKIDAQASAAMVGFFLNQHVIDSTEIITHYSR